MRLDHLFLALILVFITVSGWAQSCPMAKSLPYLPVHDQDGLGTCSANVAALMLQHNLGLPKSPSYMQMSITESAKAERFFSTDLWGTERIFNWGSHICDVVKETSAHGFCDTDKMGFEFIGTMDNTGAQQEFLVQVSRFLEAKESDIRQLRTLLRDPTSRAEAQRRLAYFFANSKTTCSLTLREFTSQRALARLKVYWSSILESSASAAAKTAAARLLALTFLPTGEPRPSALESHRDFLDANVGAAEDKFTVW